MCDDQVEATRVKSICKFDEFTPGNKLAYYRENRPFIDTDTEEGWGYCD